MGHFDRNAWAITVGIRKELVESGKLCPVIDRQYSLSEAADAVGYVGSGQARGKVVINVA